jgi:hypothetical protein
MIWRDLPPFLPLACRRVELHVMTQEEADEFINDYLDGD